MSPVHHGGDGQKTAAPSWETLTDRLIREAQERGEWDTAGWAGRRLPAQDGAYEAETAGANAILRNAGVAPPWIETDKEARRLLAERDRLLGIAATTTASGAAGLRARFGALFDELDRVLLRLETEAPTPAQQRARLDRAAALDHLERALRAGAGEVPRESAAGDDDPRAGAGT